MHWCFVLKDATAGTKKDKPVLSAIEFNKSL